VRVAFTGFMGRRSVGKACVISQSTNYFFGK
jgi:hypothetical protein